MISDDRRGRQDTLIQERVVQLIMEGKDLFGVLGWGDATAKQAVRGWSLCPSRKLTRQTTEVLAALTNSCQGVVKVLDMG